MSEYFNALKVEVFVGIRRSDLDAAIPADVLQSIRGVLDAHTELEPLHIDLVDRGYNATNTPLILALEAVAVQIDAKLNAIPQAVCVLAAGRDANALVEGASDRDASSVVHVIERYLSKLVPVRIYSRVRSTATGDLATDGGDLVPEGDEWVMSFEGRCTGPTRRGTPESFGFTLHLTHLTADLTYSSSLSGTVSAGTEMPYALNSLIYIPGTSPPSGLGWSTPAGMIAATLASGPGLYTDFWGYDVPTRVVQPPVPFADVVTPPSGGLKRFLRNLTEQDMFDWAKFRQADTGATFCPAGGFRKNDGAAAALDKMEPYAVTGADPASDWAAVLAAVTRIRTDRAAAGSTAAVDRFDLINVIGRARYQSLGYRYAMPIPFYLNGTRLGPLGDASGFGMDIAAATFHDLAPASFWELLSIKYAGRYQLAVAPTAGGAIVIPFQPLMDRCWQTVYASEVFSWDDDVRNPVPIRGVVLMGQRRSDAGLRTAGNEIADQQGLIANATADAAYDSCEPGTFIYRTMPPWLQMAFRNPAMYAPSTVNAVRTSAAVPWSTSPAAVGAAVGLAATFAAAQVNPIVQTAPPEYARSTANRMAKALFQQARTQPKSVFVTGRYRHDVAPGSILKLELPADRYVKQSLFGLTDVTMNGIVLQVTIALDADRCSASTSFQIGFARTQGESTPGTVLSADGHAFWSTTTLGCVWADSSNLRARLGDRADLNFRPLG